MSYFRILYLKHYWDMMTVIMTRHRATAGVHNAYAYLIVAGCCGWTLNLISGYTNINNNIIPTDLLPVCQNSQQQQPVYNNKPKGLNGLKTLGLEPWTLPEPNIQVGHAGAEWSRGRQFRDKIPEHQKIPGPLTRHLGLLVAPCGKIARGTRYQVPT